LSSFWLLSLPAISNTLSAAGLHNGDISISLFFADVFFFP